MHWSLDVTFNEDFKRVRKDNVPENLALLHKFAFNVFKLEKTHKKRSMKAKTLLQVIKQYKIMLPAILQGSPVRLSNHRKY
jgi:predicted transposase YbfD/YdcC